MTKPKAAPAAAIKASLQTEQIAWVLRDTGFVPSAQHEADAVHYTKDYALNETDRMRVHVFIEKTHAGSTHLRLGDLIVTTQRTVSPHDTAGLPEETRADVLRLVEELGITTASPRTLDERTCIACQRRVAEFYVVNKDAVCLQCVEQRRAARRGEA